MDRDEKEKEQPKKSPFKEDADVVAARGSGGDEESRQEEESEAEQQRKEALTERD